MLQWEMMSMHETNEKIQSLSTETQDKKTNQMGIFKLKSTITKMKTWWMRSIAASRDQSKELMWRQNKRNYPTLRTERKQTQKNWRELQGSMWTIVKDLRLMSSRVSKGGERG
jgi:hypothetical protein